jgi:hypothetical protein
MYCQKCGKKLNDDAKFCDGCGAKVVHDDAPSAPAVTATPAAPVAPVTPEPPKPVKTTVTEGRVHKCPYCGEILESGVLRCPSCGHEIRDREVVHSVQAFFERVNATSDIDTKIGLIRTFPIPNDRENILEFMLMASSNFDAAYYATNKNVDNLASAWLSKIDQCYEKGKVFLTSETDRKTMDELYQKSHGSAKRIQILKLVMIIGGFACLLTALILICLPRSAEGMGPLDYTGMGLIIAGVLLIVFGFKRKKTNKESIEDQARKDKKKEDDRKYELEKKKLEIQEEQGPADAEEEEEEDEEDDEEAEDEPDKKAKKKSVDESTEEKEN